MHEHDTMLTESQAAEMLGVRPATLRWQRCHGRAQNGIPCLPFCKLGRLVRYKRSDVQRVINESMVQPVE